MKKMIKGLLAMALCFQAFFGICVGDNGHRVIG
jgi:vacuolar-type H+-ATPase subunit I/STV1